METPTPEAVDAFLADLKAVYEKHGMYVTACCLGGAAASFDPHAPERVRVRARFTDPENGDWEEYEEHLYETVSAAELAVDQIRKRTELPHKYVEY